MMKLFFASILIFVSVGISNAQYAPGKIEGYVRDLKGQAIIGATVYAYDTAKVTGRFVRLTTTSDSSGMFVLANLPQGSYRVHAYKESDGYADTFYLFFKPSSNQAWKNVQVRAGTLTKIVLELGPKFANLKVSIKDEQGNPIGGGIAFWRLDYSDALYRVGASPESTHLVPPLPFRFEVSSNGYQSWTSKVITLPPGETAEFTIHLVRAR